MRISTGIRHLCNSAGAAAILTAVAFPPSAVAAMSDGAEPPHTALCEPHATGFAGLYCPWDQTTDGETEKSPNRSFDRAPARR